MKSADLITNGYHVTIRLGQCNQCLIFEHALCVDDVTRMRAKLENKGQTPSNVLIRFCALRSCGQHT